jgi:hypothetical protein
VRATRGLLHIKTSGTSYLEALWVACEHAPDLFRDVFAASQSAYKLARRSYQVSADHHLARDPAGLREDELGELLRDPASRQVLHVGYGELISPRQSRGGRSLLEELRAVLLANSRRYAEHLDEHMGRHLKPLRRLS